MRFVLTVLFTLGIGLQAGAADLKAIPRVILKEPVYEGKPKYCLLVFGQKADTRIWMVYDGKHFYVDHKGNGDLTEPGVLLGAAGGASFSLNQIVERDGTAHRNLSVNAHKDGTFDMMLGQGGERTQYVGVGRMARPTWGDKAEDAPIIHFNGPMTLEQYGPMHTIARGTGSNRRFSLRVMLGTPGLGKGTFASYDEVCSEKLGNIQADIIYLSAEPFGAITRQRIELIHDG